MNKYEMKHKLEQELRCSLPSKRFCDVVSTAYVILPNNEVVFLKDRNKFRESLKDAAQMKTDYIVHRIKGTEEEIARYQGKIVRIMYSAFSVRGKEMILDYLKESYINEMKQKLENGTKDEDFILTAESIFQEQMREMDEWSSGTPTHKPHSIQEEKEIEDIPKENAEKEETIFTNRKREGKDILDILNETKAIFNNGKDLEILLSGSPGSGKTHFLVKALGDMINTGFFKETQKEDKSDWSEENENQTFDSGEDSESFEIMLNKLKDAGYANKEEDDYKRIQSSFLYNDASYVGLISKDGKVKTLKSRGGQGFDSSKDYLFVKNLNDIQFYPKGFFKGKNLLIQV